MIRNFKYKEELSSLHQLSIFFNKFRKLRSYLNKNKLTIANNRAPEQK